MTDTTDDRKITLLRAARDILKTCDKNWQYDVMVADAFYDGKDRDGEALLADIEAELGIDPDEPQLTQPTGRTDLPGPGNAPGIYDVVGYSAQSQSYPFFRAVSDRDFDLLFKPNGEVPPECVSTSWRFVLPDNPWADYNTTRALDGFWQSYAE